MLNRLCLRLKVDYPINEKVETLLFCSFGYTFCKLLSSRFDILEDFMDSIELNFAL